jgi:hypothetical protein
MVISTGVGGTEFGYIDDRNGNAQFFKLYIGTITGRTDGQAIYITTGVVFNTGAGVIPIYMGTSNSWDGLGILKATTLRTAGEISTQGTGQLLTIQGNVADMVLKIFGAGNIIQEVSNDTQIKYGSDSTGVYYGTFTVYGIYVSSGYFDQLYVKGAPVLTGADLSGYANKADVQNSTNTLMLIINASTPTLQGVDTGLQNQITASTPTLQAMDTSLGIGTRTVHQEINASTPTIVGIINASTPTLQGIDTGLQNQITASTPTLQGVDTGLQNQITASTPTLVAADTNLQNEIHASTPALQGVDTGLQNQITASTPTIVGIITASTPTLQGVDTSLQNQITASTPSLVAVDNNLSAQIHASTPTLQGVDSGLQTQISVSTPALQAVDTGLQNQITASTPTLEAMDTTLQNEITASTPTLKNMITASTPTLQGVDTGLQNQITASTPTLQGVDTGLQNQITASTPTLQGIDTSLQNQITASTPTLKNMITASTPTLQGVDTGLQNQITASTPTLLGLVNSKLPESPNVVVSSEIAPGAVTESKTTAWKVSLTSGVTGVLPLSNFSVWNSTHVIPLVFGSTDAVTGLIFSSATVDIPVPYNMTIKAWCIDENSLPAISGSCTVSVSTRAWGGTHVAIDGGTGTDNTKRPNMVSQTSSSGTTAGWAQTTAGAGGCIKVTVLTSSLIKQITVGLMIWKPEP